MGIFARSLGQHSEAHDAISMAERTEKPVKTILQDAATLSEQKEHIQSHRPEHPASLGLLAAKLAGFTSITLATCCSHRIKCVALRRAVPKLCPNGTASSALWPVFPDFTFSSFDHTIQPPSPSPLTLLLFFFLCRARPS